MFMLCGFFLIGRQQHVAVGLEILAVSLIAAVFVSGCVRAMGSSVSNIGLSIFRTIGGATCYLVESAVPSC